MSDGRSLVYPQALAFGARLLSVPGRGTALCASALLPFRLSDGECITPADWYGAVSAHGGPGAIPDSMAPLPGAEVLILGVLPPVADVSRRASLHCGSIMRRFVLYRDPGAPDAPLLADPSAALWHDADNPAGRGGPDDARSPLIVDEAAPERPLWLGPTPFDHPVRLRRVGVPDEHSGAGWPAGADAAALHDAHDAFWAEALHPGEPLAWEGLSEHALETHLPHYRVSITSGRLDGRWIAESTRIHCVILIPAADLAAVISRACIDLGDDPLGESVVALVAALEDRAAPVKDAQHWGGIAADRWQDPILALDDRPLLPAALASAVVLPFSTPGGEDPMDARRAATEAWIREEAGLPEENPFASAAPEEANLAEQAREAIAGDAPPDANALAALAGAALAAGKRRHEEAGFPEPPLEQAREPVTRGARLDAEADKRLSMPYCTPHEVAVAHQIRATSATDLDPGEILGKITDARIQNPTPPLLWPALDEAEGVRFGEKLAERLTDGTLERHIDVSGAIVVAGSKPQAISGRRLDGFLAEDTTWRGTQFADCTLTASSFAGARFEDCEFRDCTFDRVNLSRATLTGCTFRGCTFRDLQLAEPVWMESQLEGCVWERVSMTDPAMRDVTFSGGAWREVQWSEGLLIGIALRETALHEVTFANTHAPHSRFERLSMHKVWALAKGFPGSVFVEVEATTCGFLGTCHFDEARFVRTRFAETGFANAVFKDAHLAADCRFDACDLSGAVFENTTLSAVRFLQCAMTMSQWSSAKAADAWFFGSILRGVDLADTELARAVFTDADLEGAKLDPDRTIGADFRGALGSPA